MKMENQFWFLEHKREEYEYYRDSLGKDLYYDPHKKKWVKREEYTGSWFPATFCCRSYRAAKRHLKNHDEIPKGTKFVLVSSYVGQDRLLTKK